MSTNEIEPTAPPTSQDEKAISETTQIRQRVWGLEARVDPSVTFEEYRYWAKIEREEEAEDNRKYIAEQGPWTFGKMIKARFSKGIHHERAKREQKEQREIALQTLQESSPGSGDEKKAVADAAENGSSSSVSVTDEEWKTAARALRTASWGTIFFLVTTDILGWMTCPFVFASVGYGPGVALYVIFGFFAAVSGIMLWRVFIGLDSSRYPMLSFGDTYFRVYGPWSRHFINVMQSLMQFFTVSQLVLNNGMVISQLSGPGLCFIACMVIATVIGIVCGMVRSLQRLGWLCNLSVWINVTQFIIIMIASSHFGIDYQVVTSSTLIKTIAPVVTFAGPPPDQYQQQAYGFAGQFGAVNLMVFAYAGALLFIAFMAEMRHPMDFWKGMLCAQIFICFVYMLFGAFVYGQFGQYSASNVGQVIKPHILRTVGNVLNLMTGFIACILYFNIGLKTVYVEVFQEVLHFPVITSKKGRWIWYGLGPVYWIVALLVAAAIPNLTGVISFISGLWALNFTYSFPGLVYLGYNIHSDAALPGEGFDPITGVTTRHDSGPKRWMRGYMKNWHINTFILVYVLGGLASSGMGVWAAVEGLIAVFGPGGTLATSFGCQSPVWSSSG